MPGQPMQAWFYKLRRTHEDDSSTFKRHLTKAWSRRYFVIIRDRILWYKSADATSGEKPCGFVNFQQVLRIRVLHSESRMEDIFNRDEYGTYSIQIDSNLRKLVIRTPSRDLAKVWVFELRRKLALWTDGNRTGKETLRELSKETRRVDTKDLLLERIDRELERVQLLSTVEPEQTIKQKEDQEDDDDVMVVRRPKKDKKMKKPSSSSLSSSSSALKKTKVKKSERKSSSKSKSDKVKSKTDDALFETAAPIKRKSSRRKNSNSTAAPGFAKEEEKLIIQEDLSEKNFAEIEQSKHQDEQHYSSRRQQQQQQQKTVPKRDPETNHKSLAILESLDEDWDDQDEEELRSMLNGNSIKNRHRTSRQSSVTTTIGHTSSKQKPRHQALQPDNTWVEEDWD